MNFVNSLVIGFFLRVGIVYFINYTDIDYLVYSDGAKYVLQGGSPYDRHTYRYTPLVSYLMIPNILLNEYFGKFLFILIDMYLGYLIKKILRLTNHLKESQIENLNLIVMANPMACLISARGSADTIICTLVLQVVLYLLQKKYLAAGIVYGFCVHFKIYPILYALPFYLFIDRAMGVEKRGLFTNFFTKNRIIFTLTSASVFLFLTALFYFIYGYQFLYEGYLYHAVRKDNRHNFSLFFYYIYLNFESMTQIQSILTFLPQIVLVVLAGLRLYKDLIFCIFTQTFVFVLYNKVCTGQYYLWYLVYLPLFLQNNNLFNQNNTKKLKWTAILASLWFAPLIYWTILSDELEKQGINTFNSIWISTIFIFVCHSLVFSFILNNQNLKNLVVVAKITKTKQNEKIKEN